jgi:Domain of unknown function (DUF4395)
VPVADHPAPTRLVDPRGLRFVASVTSLVLAAAFLLQAPWLVAVQALVFAVGAAAGLRRAPYSLLFRLVRDLARLGPPRRTEPEAPPRFAQLLGGTMLLAALLSFAAGLSGLAWGLVLAALAAAVLNATTGLCLGCELYLLGQRLGRRAA